LFGPIPFPARIPMASDIPSQARVVIIGGGVIGCSVAYHLAKRGWKDVLLLERKELTSGTTWHAAGLIGQLRATQGLTQLAVYTAELYEGLEKETGQAIGYKRNGSLSVACDHERFEEMKRGASMASNCGLEVQVLTPGQAKEKYPLLRVDDVVGAVFLPRDGALNPIDVTRALAIGARQNGVRIVEHTKVTGVTVEKGRAVGVRLADGSEVRADAVIAACDGRSVLFDMLGGRYMTEKTRQHYATWQTFKPLLMATFGVARLFPGEPAFTTVILDRPFAIGSETIPGLFIRLFNYGEGYAPPGKSVLQATSESGWEHWNTLRGQDPALYRAEKRRVAGEILDRLEVLYPGLSGQVEVSDVATPYTTWRYTRNHEGAWEGWLMTAQAMRTSIERTLPGLERLYLAGQWVMPGGGVPPVLYSGRHAVQLLCRDDGMTGLP